MNGRSLFVFLFSCALLLMFGSFSTNDANTYSITVKICGIRNTEGRIQLQIYRDQESFKNENPWKTTYISKKDLTGSSLSQKITGFKGGVYGLALLDDEDSNTKMTYGLVWPKEGFGFSDYYHTGWSRPTFDDFKFHLTANKTVTMKIRYV